MTNLTATFGPGIPTRASAGPDLAVELVTVPTQFENFRREWEQLCLVCADATPFHSPAWLVSWWHCFAPGELRSLAFRNQGRLVGIAPLFVRYNASTKEREIQFIGTGNTDYLGVVFARGFEQACGAALWDVLQALEEDWDVCDFQQLRAGSVPLELGKPSHWFSQLNQDEVCPFLDLTTVERRAGPARMLQRAAAAHRRLERFGTVRVTCACPEDFDEHIEILTRLHVASRRTRGGQNALGDPAMQAFVRAAGTELLENNALRLYVLRAGERGIAALYALVDPDRFYFYLGGYDPEFGRFSPGTVLIAHAIEEARRNGAIEFDFLRGGEPYKYRWGALDRWNYRLRLWHASPGR